MLPLNLALWVRRSHQYFGVMVNCNFGTLHSALRPRSPKSYFFLFSKKMLIYAL